MPKTPFDKIPDSRVTNVGKRESRKSDLQNIVLVQNLLEEEIIPDKTYYFYHDGQLSIMRLTRKDGKHLFCKHDSNSEEIVTNRENIICPTVEPATTDKKKYIYHTTLMSNYDSIQEIGLVPVNTLFKMSINPLGGLDDSRNAEEGNIIDEIYTAKMILAENKDPHYRNGIIKRTADILLGPKGNFIYGSQIVNSFENYLYMRNEDILVLRWKPMDDEIYYKDLEDDTAVKLMGTISPDRLGWTKISLAFLKDKEKNNESIKLHEFTYENLSKL